MNTFVHCCGTQVRLKCERTTYSKQITIRLNDFTFYAWQAEYASTLEDQPPEKPPQNVAFIHSQHMEGGGTHDDILLVIFYILYL